MLTYSFENMGNDTLYEHLYKLIKNDILNGTLTAGYKLPSKRAFAKNLNISTITIENAYSQLIAEGYIYSIPKKGYFVSALDGIMLRTEAAANNPKLENEQETTITINSSVGNPSFNSVFNDNTYSHLPDYDANILYDFASNSTSKSVFPFTIWAKLMRDILSENHDKLMTTTPGTGSYELRFAIARHLMDFRGMNVKPEQIIIGAGTEYLYSIIIQLLGRNLTYAVEDPGYKKISQVYSSNQVKVCHVPVTNNGINVTELDKSNADVLHLSPSHHFPTGIVTPVSKRYELLGWAAKASSNQRYIIEDDYDSEFRLMGRPIPSLQSIDVMERVIYMNSFSKSLASTIRISYMVLPPHLMDKYNKLLSFYSCTVSTFEQYTLARFISDGYFEKHINRMRNYYRGLRDSLVLSIKKSQIASICDILEDDAGLHFLLKVDTNLNDVEIKRRAKENGLKISCLSDYYYLPEQAQEHILIVNYSGLDEAVIPSAIAALEKCFMI